MTEGIAFGDLPTKTYAITNGRVIGKIDGITAMKQHIEKTLITERFNYVIYTSYYGTEYMDLFGKDRGFVELEIFRRIKEALLIDSRILSVSDFKILSFDQGIMHVKFSVATLFGEVLQERQVNLNG